MKYLIALVVLNIILTVLISGRTGDMNGDGILDIKDLSILAYTINEQR